MQLLRIVIPGLALALTACQAKPPQLYPSLEASTELLAANPSDIAVLPVEDATEERTAKAMLGLIRTEIALALVQRMYSPLAPAAVDEVLAAQPTAAPTTSVVDAAWLHSVGGKFGEDATLALRITQWDATSLMATGRVRFAVDVSLMAPGGTSPLWGGELRGEVKAGGEGPAPRDRAGRSRAAAVQFAAELIRLMPRRVRGR